MDKRLLLKGLAVAAACYGIGAVLAGLSYLILGQEYAHAPGLHHLVVLLFLAIGALWFIRNLVFIISKVNSFEVGNIVVHALVFTLVYLYFYLEIRQQVLSLPYNEPTVLTLIIPGDTIKGTVSGSSLYYKIGGSTYYGFTASARLDEIELIHLDGPDHR